MARSLLVIGGILGIILLFLGVASYSTYNDLVGLDEGVEASSAEIINQYKRRADLIPQLVATVKGYAEHEKEVLSTVTEARSRVGSVQISAQDLSDPATLQRFEQAQQQLSGALSRLIAVAENYPQLKADGAFRDLQAQLEGTENRIAVARGRFIETVREFNTRVRRFPANIFAGLFGFERKATFSVDDDSIADPPKVDFGS